jgi:RHS repeat-associated protein
VYKRQAFDSAGRLVGATNALGAFGYAYDASSGRLISSSAPNGQTTQRNYGNILEDFSLERIAHTIGATPISEFLYSHDTARDRITTWSQQTAAQSPNQFSLSYDAVDQLITATVTNAGNLVNTFAYSYDPPGNRLTEQAGASNYTSTYNGLNEISTTTAPGAPCTNEWDAANRLVAVTVGNNRTEFTCDGLGRMVGIRKLVNGSEVSRRRFVWCNGRICEERDAGGALTKRFFDQGVKLETGPLTGSFFYTLDHLGSIRELTDASGNVRARYSYDPYGRRIKLSGDVDADFGFAEMFFSSEANLSLTRFRAYDAESGRWLSRDPLRHAETRQGPNLYAYVGNEPISRRDPEGLLGIQEDLVALCAGSPVACHELMKYALGAGVAIAVRVATYGPQVANALQCAGPEIPAIAETSIPSLETEIGELEAEYAVAGGRFQAILERLPDGRRQWQAFVDSVRARGDFLDIATDRWLDLGGGGRIVPGSPQMIVELETALDELKQVAPQLHGILARNFDYLGMGSRWH